MSERDAYRDAGVDVAAGNEAASRYARLAQKTRRPEVLAGVGGFSSGFLLDVQRFREPVLVSGTDGVGTKLKVAFATGRHDTIGIDCVAMCVNDILTSGAEPLFFLDYLATGHLNVDIAEAVVGGVAVGCEEAGCALVGGETAEMPDMYSEGEYDLAGTVVGCVDRSRHIDGRSAKPGDIVLGLASSGVHSNGYSLVRKLVHQAGLNWNDELPGWRGTVGEELLRPTRIYVKSILKLLNEGSVQIRGMAHITGGGLVENLPRCLPETVGAILRPSRWERPAVFEWLVQASGLSFAEAARVWNMGIGYALVLSQNDAEHALNVLQGAGETAYIIGEVAEMAHEVRFDSPAKVGS